MNSHEENPHGLDDVEGILKENVQFRQLARMCAQQEKEITDLMQKIDVAKANQEEIYGFFREDGDGIISYNSEHEINGDSDIDVDLLHFMNGLEQELFARNLGVNTPNRLILGLYTDQALINALREYDKYEWAWGGVKLDERLVKEFLTDEEFDSATYSNVKDNDGCGTNYFVDLEGNYAKVVSLPEELAQGRDRVDIEGHHIDRFAYILEPMTPRDFVIIRTALTLIQQRAEQAVLVSLES